MVGIFIGKNTVCQLWLRLKLIKYTGNMAAISNINAVQTALRVNWLGINLLTYLLKPSQGIF